MAQGIRKMKNYNEADSFYFEQANTRGYFFFVLSWLLIILTWLILVLSFATPAFRSGFIIGFMLFSLIANLLFTNGYYETGIETDFIDKKYRNYFSKGYLRRGKWKPFEEPDFFLIEKSTNSFNWWRTKTGFARMHRNILFGSEPYYYFQLFLITKGAHDHLIFTTEEQDPNISTAKHLAYHLKIPVYERNISGDVLIYSPTPDQHNT